MSDSCLSSSLSWMCKSMIWSRLIVMLKMNILLSSTQNSIQETIYRKFWPESLHQHSVVYIICKFLWKRFCRLKIPTVCRHCTCTICINIMLSCSFPYFSFSLWCRVLLFSLAGVDMLHFTCYGSRRNFLQNQT